MQVITNLLQKVNSTFGNVVTYAAIGAGTYLIARAIYKEYTKYDLQGKVVLITGGSRGLGLVLARQLAEKGAKLVICARSIDQLGNAHIELESMGAEVLSLAVDVTDPHQVDAMIGDTIRHYGRLDVLINNAGIMQVAPQQEFTMEDYEIAMKTNFWSALYTMTSVIPHMKVAGGGRIVNITSIGGKVAIPHMLPYTASKFALVGLSEGMHTELKRSNINVTTAVPYLMNTGSARNAFVKGSHEAEYAWFKIAGSTMSQETDIAAERIVRAVEYGEAESTLSFTAKAATVIQGLVPGFMGTLMRIVNLLLPSGRSASGHEELKGYESESSISHGWLGRRVDEAAVRNNEY